MTQSKQLHEWPLTDLIAEVIIRLKETNGIEFCSDDQLGELIDCLVSEGVIRT